MVGQNTLYRSPLIRNYVQNFISDKPHPAIIFKPHYRESFSKYSSLNQEFPLSSICDPHIPVQLLFSSFSHNTRISLVGFHSSALFCNPEIFSIVSLSAQVRTPAAIALLKGLNMFIPFFPQFKLYA